MFINYKLTFKQAADKEEHLNYADPTHHKAESWASVVRVCVCMCECE